MANKKPTKAELAAILAARTAEGVSDQDVRRAVDAALRAVEPGYMGIECVYPDEGKVIYYVSPEDEWKMKRRTYTMADDGTASLGDDAVEVEPVTTYETVMASKKAAVATAPKQAADCGCKQGVNSMDKTKKAELIAALVTDPHSGFREGDEALLETAADERLQEFATAAATRKAEAEAKVKLENENRAAQAKLKVAEEKLKVAEQAPTDEQWLAKAPAGIKTLLERQEKQDIERRAELTTLLKTAQAEYTEDELKAMALTDLERLARAVKVETSDFSGRGVPHRAAAAAANEGTNDFAPPSPYKAGLDQLRSKAVN